MFHIIPENFFVPLSSPNRLVYWECISRLFAIMEHQLSFGVEREVLVEELEFYEYAPTDTMRHLFVRMEGEAESIPYFMLDKECWSEIVDALLVVYTSPS